MIAPQPHMPLSHPLPIVCPSDFTPLERLGSPIHLADIAPPVACIPPSRRRPKISGHSLRRRRVTSRVHCPTGSQSHAFDGLPWISTLEASPELVNPWDIADLSLIPDSCLSDSPPSGPGPVRRRKSSLRSNPMSTSPSGSPLPIRDTSLLTSPSVPTPRSRFIPSRVLFHNLMPISCDCRSEQSQSHPCINSSRIAF